MTTQKERVLKQFERFLDNAIKSKIIINCECFESDFVGLDEAEEQLEWIADEMDGWTPFL